MAITGSRVMIFYHCHDEDLSRNERVRRIFVWDWKTGDLVSCHDSTSYSSLTSPPQVLNLLSTDGDGLVTLHTQIFFLDEFRMGVLPNTSAIKELIVFNTLIPQGGPGNLRRLGLPQRFCGRVVDISVDHDRPLV